nr:phosphoribosylformylglycinamidine synthase subunit PurL [Ardenticatena sp.]
MSTSEQPHSTGGIAQAAVPSYRIEVVLRCPPDHMGARILRTAHAAGFSSLTRCQVRRLFFIRGRLRPEDLDRIARRLLTDPVTETYQILPQSSTFPPPSPDTAPPDAIIDVTWLPGVTDPVAENLLRAARLIGVDTIEAAATGTSYHVWGLTETDEVAHLAEEVLCNTVVQRYSLNTPILPAFITAQHADGTVETIPIRNANDAQLEAISRERRLALDLDEMRAIREYFQREAREPTDAELEMLAQTWSEHCVHKTFKARILYEGPPHGAPPDAEPVQQTIDGLLRTYLRAATERVAREWVHSAFVDNAGIIAFDEHFDVAFKVETHNHPSAIEPFGGANTGVGGVVRDILGVSARPIANTDVLCFGPTDLPDEEVPPGALHPRRIEAGVVHGIEDYGNKMGIPTVDGAVFYHPGYTANPLVYCGCVGLLPHGSHPSDVQPGDLIVVMGGRTGRDGLRGATFSSMEMDAETGDIAGSAVQIGHPINEKQVQEVVIEARDAGLYHAITDCGAGGLSSAVGEMGAKIGATVHLERVPLKYAGLRPWKIWLSEAQERMVLAVAPDDWPRLRAICDKHGVEAVAIGTFEPTGRLKLFYGDRVVGDLDMHFLHEGLPQRTMHAIWRPPTGRTTPPATPLSPGEALQRLLAHPNIRSRERIIRRYDHEVQGGTTVKPLVGVADHGPSDGAVIVPLGTYHPAEAADTTRPLRGLALSVGICPQYGELDPYAMAWAAIDEAVRNAVAIGADPDHLAILDNFCWGNPNLPDRLGSLVRCAQGCYDAALAYGTPYISGKDSLNNEYTTADGERHAIPGTLLISAIGLVPDIRRTTTLDLKAPGNLLYIVGDTRAELGGSHYADIVGMHDTRVPQPVPNAIERARALHRAMREGLVQACHDCSEGGLGVALAEMALAGRLGVEVNVEAVPGSSDVHDDAMLLFSESLARWVVEVHPDDAAAFEEIMRGIPHARIGAVCAEPTMRILGRAGSLLIETPIVELERAWRGEPSPAHTSPRRAYPTAPAIKRTPRVLILHARGTNRDHEAALAAELAGGAPEIVLMQQLLDGERNLLDYHMLVVPGGFSYGDDLGAGALWALDLQEQLGEPLRRFVAEGRPVLGICNGFQALIKAGLLPGLDWPPAQGERVVTLAPNASATFECRWVWLEPNPNTPSLFIQGLDAPIHCPVAHGEGRFVARDADILAALQRDNLVALTYTTPDGSDVRYPYNPNGSDAHIAGICNPAGNVLGLMPHPEDHIFPWQHPRHHRGEQGLDGLRLFINGIRAC